MRRAVSLDHIHVFSCTTRVVSRYRYAMPSEQERWERWPIQWDMGRGGTMRDLGHGKAHAYAALDRVYAINVRLQGWTFPAETA